MSFSVTQEDILSVPADAAALSVEIGLDISDGASFRRLETAGGEALRQALRELRFLPVGAAARVEPCGLPFRMLFAAASPRWLTGKANELLALRRCYRQLFSLALGQGCRSLVLPFLSVQYYRFPPEEAVFIARSEAERTALAVTFAADTPELFRLSGRAYRKPRIVSYVGWYRDDAYFALDNGQYARVDLRPELERIAMIPYIEACCRAGNNPLQTPLPASEIARLRAVYERNEL